MMRHRHWMLLASRHEFSDRCAERAFAIVEAFNSRKVVFAFLDQQFSAESMSLTCLVVFRCQPSYFRCFPGTARDNEWRTGGRDFETRALTNNHFMGQLQSRLQIGIWQSAKIVDTADGDAAFDHIVRQAVSDASDTPAPSPLHYDSLSNEFAGSFKQVLQTYVQESDLSIDFAAALCNTSKRSLQRKLAESGTRYSEVLDQVRFHTACRMLQAPNIKVADVAKRLGYSEPTHFSRAFRRIAGITPRMYRQHHHTDH